MIKRLACMMLATFAMATVSAAQEKQDLSIREAAVARMQERLGTIRGSISIKDQHVRLTQKMLDRLKPASSARPENTPARPIDEVVTHSTGLQKSNIDQEGILDIDTIMMEADAVADQIKQGQL